MAGEAWRLFWPRAFLITEKNPVEVNSLTLADFDFHCLLGYSCGLNMERKCFYTTGSY